MYEFTLRFSGEIPAVHGDQAEHGEVLEKIGREVVELLRQQGYAVREAKLHGPRAVDLFTGAPKPVVNEDVTKNERAKKPVVPPVSPGKAGA